MCSFLHRHRFLTVESVCEKNTLGRGRRDGACGCHAVVVRRRPVESRVTHRCQSIHRAGEWRRHGDACRPMEPHRPTGIEEVTVAGGTRGRRLGRMACVVRFGTSRRPWPRRPVVRSCRLPRCRSAATRRAGLARSRSGRGCANGIGRGSRGWQCPSRRFRVRRGSASRTGSRGMGR
mgnify:FL=1